MESRTDAGFWTASDEELDMGDLVYIAGGHGEGGGGGFFILALIEGINDNKCWSVGSFEWANNKRLHL